MQFYPQTNIDCLQSDIGLWIKLYERSSHRKNRRFWGGIHFI